MSRAARLLVAAAVLLAVAPAIAGDLIRLTQGTEGWRKPSVDLRGRHVVYVSSGALFQHDAKKGDVVIVAHRDVGDARISAKGKLVVYSSDGDLLGTNLDGNEEIFLHDVRRSTTTQVTVTTGCSSKAPTIDKRGRRIAFRSDGDLVGDNPDRNEEIFLKDVAKGDVTQITNTLAPTANGNPELVAGGKYVYFSSDADPLSTNPERNREIFRYVVRTGVLEQLTTTTTGNCAKPSPSKTGKLVLFESSSVELAGPNIDGEAEIYVLNVRKGAVTRVTDYDFESTNASLSGNGKIITFESRGDPLGTNLDGSWEIFQTWWKKGSWETIQITSGEQTDRSRRSVLSCSGKRTFFESDADLTSEGAGTEHIFQFTR
ncbi:MAG: TolB family protein [Planctomycetota bacterium]|jgi:Tol biopolymer transport system component